MFYPAIIEAMEEYAEYYHKLELSRLKKRLLKTKNTQIMTAKNGNYTDGFQTGYKFAVDELIELLTIKDKDK